MVSGMHDRDGWRTKAVRAGTVVALGWAVIASEGCIAAQGRVRIVDPPPGTRVLAVYEAPETRQWITVDVVAFMVARSLGRAMDEWELRQEKGLRDLSKALRVASPSGTHAPWAATIGTGAAALLDGWPDEMQSLPENVRRDLDQWRRHESVFPPVAFRASYLGDGEPARRLERVFSARRWIADAIEAGLDFDLQEPSVVADRYQALARTVAMRKGLGAWLEHYDSVVDALVAGGLEGVGAMPSDHSSPILAALRARRPAEDDALARLDPDLASNRTYLGGLDLLAVGPFASASGRAVWREVERSTEARAIVEASREERRGASVYAQVLGALAHLSAPPATWARRQAFVAEPLWTLRTVQSQLAGWVCLRRSLARQMKIHVYGGRREGIPEVLVDPYPRTFVGLARAARAAATALRPGMPDASVLEELAGLATGLDLLADVAERGVEAAREHAGALAALAESLSDGTYLGGREATLGDEEIAVARFGSGTLMAGIGKARRLIVEVEIDGETVPYQGVVMSYRERWEGTPLLRAASGLDLSGRVYDWGAAKLFPR